MKPTQTLLTYRTKQSVDLLKDDGTHLAKVDATVYVQNGIPALAVHRPVWVEKDETHTQLSGYNITHVPTGMKITDTKTQQRAKRLAALLLTLDWTQPIEGARRSEINPSVRAILTDDSEIQFSTKDHCCVQDCRNPVLLRYSVNITHRPFLLCEQHWTKLNSATTEKGWYILLKQMRYSPDAIQWWTTQRNIAVTSRRTKDDLNGRTKMPRRKEKRSQEEEVRALAESKAKAKAKREETKRNPLELPDGTLLTETPEGFDWEKHPAIQRKWFQIDWQHLVHRAEGHDHEAAKLRDKAEKLKSSGSQKDRAKMTRLTNMRNNMAKLREELEADGIDVDSHLNEASLEPAKV